MPTDPIARVAFRLARANGALSYKALREIIVLHGDLNRARSTMSKEDVKNARSLLCWFRADLEIAHKLTRHLLKDLLGRPEACAGAEPTITPEATLLEAGIDDARQAAYQRKMSTLLGRSAERA